MIWQESCPNCGGQAVGGGYIHRPNCSELKIESGNDVDRYNAKDFEKYTGMFSQTDNGRIIELLTEIRNLLKKDQGVEKELSQKTIEWALCGVTELLETDYRETLADTFNNDQYRKEKKELEVAVVELTNKKTAS